MRKTLVALAAASLAAGSFAFMGNRLWADNYGGSKTEIKGEARTGTLPQGITAAPADQIDSQGIRSTLSTTVDDLFSSNWNGFTSQFASNDQQRLNDFNHTDLDKTIAQFKADWKAKYNQDFNLAGKQEVVFGNTYQGFQIVQGDVTNPALLSNWPMEYRSTEKESTGHNDMHSSAGGPGSPPVNVTPRDNNTGNRVDIERSGKETTGRELKSGMTVAVVTFPGQKNAGETTVSLIKEGATANVNANKGGEHANVNAGNTWKIDIPDSIDGQKLSRNLNKHLSEVDQMKDQWPSNVDDAYRLVSQHTFMAMYDTSGVTGNMHMHTGQSEK